MPHSPANRTAATGSFLATIAAAILIWSQPGDAQVVIQGGGPGNFVSFDAPGFRDLLRPDFQRRDAALLAGELELTSDQRYVLELVLEDYGKGFDAAAAPLRDALKKRGPFGGQVARAFGPDGAAGIGEVVMPAMREAMGGAGASFIGDGNVDVMMLDDGGGVMTFISSNAGPPPPGMGGPGAPGDGDRQVMVHAEVHLASADGTPMLPDDVRARVEEALKRHLEERLKAGDDPALPPPPAPSAPGTEPAGGAMAADDAPPPTAEQIAALASSVLSAKIAARTQFVEDVKDILAPEQAERWPGAEQKLRRVNSLPRGRLSGERIDLILILNRVIEAAQTPQAIAAGLAQYAVRLDAALSQRDDFLTRTEIDLFLARDSGDQTRQGQIQDSQTPQHLAVRGVNEEFTGLIASALTPELADAFRKAVKEASYDRIFRQTRTQRVFNAAKAVEGLDPAVLQTVKAMEESYLAELAAANERLVTITRDNEPRQDRHRAEMMGAMAAALRAGQPPPPPPSDPIADEFAKRNQLGRSYLERIKATLSPEQFDSLPGAKQTLEFPSGAFIQRFER